MSHVKFGKTAARPDAVKFKFSKYAVSSKLPKPPRNFGHETVLPSDAWGMMANDKYGCCVLAGAAHESMLWSRVSKSCPDASFTDSAVLAAYSAITGFDPARPDTDQGTDMKEAASYRRKTDESIAYLSADMFDNRKSAEGFDYDALLADLQALG